jgi:hypothetical protein
MDKNAIIEAFMSGSMEWDYTQIISCILKKIGLDSTIDDLVSFAVRCASFSNEEEPKLTKEDFYKYYRHLADSMISDDGDGLLIKDSYVAFLVKDFIVPDQYDELITNIEFGLYAVYYKIDHYKIIGFPEINYWGICHNVNSMFFDASDLNDVIKQYENPPYENTNLLKHSY